MLSAKRFTYTCIFLSILLAVFYSCNVFRSNKTTKAADNKIVSTLPTQPVTYLADTLPEENRFKKVTLSRDLKEPMELAVTPAGDVLFIERKGRFLMYDAALNITRVLYNFTITTADELNGLLGLTIHPDFENNGYIYLLHTVNEHNNPVQHLSRYTLKKSDTKLDISTEKILLKIPFDHAGRTHTGGSMTWDKYGNLYVSVGDNTGATQAQGYGAMNEMPGHEVFDAQRSSANTNDLRGKILRIHPEADGTYTIPAGNLFEDKLDNTRPEIYVMGCRNPFRISVDTATSILYWGEVGPDAYMGGNRGPVGYDEVNQAKCPGNYGWPYFVADNKPYAKYDFANEIVGDFFDPALPVNNSVNNTGIKNLPPAQKAMIWYPYAKSDEFPQMEAGGRTAMAGPVYHYSDTLSSTVKFPRYYDKKFFSYDWMRKLVFSVTFDGDNNYKSIERFLPQTGDFIRPMDMEFGRNGALYVLEYGTTYGADNPDSRLVRIEYNSGNRAPQARMAASVTSGQLPLTVNFNGSKSFDFDAEDTLQYQWNFGDGSSLAQGQKQQHIYTVKGVYKAVLTVTDGHGKSTTDTLNIVAGNTAPQVDIHLSGNSTFFFPQMDSRNYRVTVTDNEENIPDRKSVNVSFNYFAEVATSATNLHDELSTIDAGEALIAANDCKACHQIDKKVIGPAFMAVSKKYENSDANVSKLAQKVITGGSGVWGNDFMNGHPQLAKSDAETIVRYILSLSRQSGANIPMQGSIQLNRHLQSPGEGRYLLSATYTDNGNRLKPLTTTKNFVLRPTVINGDQADMVSHIKINKADKGDFFRQQGYLDGIYNQSYFMLKDIDLSGINAISLFYAAGAGGTQVKIHTQSINGRLIGTLHCTPTGGMQRYADGKTTIVPTSGRHNLYFEFVNVDNMQQPLAAVRTITFLK